MTALEILVAVRDLLSDRDKWTRGSSARDQSGAPTFVHEDRAVCWCLGGAMQKVVPEGQPWSHILHARKAIQDVIGESAEYVNDALGYEYVMSALDRAIETYEAFQDYEAALRG